MHEYQVFRPTYVSFHCYGTRRRSSGVASWRSTAGTAMTRSVATTAPTRRLQDSFDPVCRRWGVQADPNAGKRFADGVAGWGAHADVPAHLTVTSLDGFNGTLGLYDSPHPRPRHG